MSIMKLKKYKKINLQSNHFIQIYLDFIVQD